MRHRAQKEEKEGYVSMGSEIVAVPQTKAY